MGTSHVSALNASGSQCTTTTASTGWRSPCRRGIRPLSSGPHTGGSGSPWAASPPVGVGAFDLTDCCYHVQLLATVLQTQATMEDLGVTPCSPPRVHGDGGPPGIWTSAFHLRSVHAWQADGRMLWLAKYKHAGPDDRTFVPLHAGHAARPWWCSSVRQGLAEVRLAVASCKSGRRMPWRLPRILISRTRLRTRPPSTAWLGGQRFPSAQCPDPLRVTLNPGKR